MFNNCIIFVHLLSLNWAHLHFSLGNSRINLSGLLCVFPSFFPILVTTQVYDICTEHHRWPYTLVKDTFACCSALVIRKNCTVSVLLLINHCNEFNNKLILLLSSSSALLVKSSNSANIKRNVYLGMRPVFICFPVTDTFIASRF